VWSSQAGGRGTGVFFTVVACAKGNAWSLSEKRGSSKCRTRCLVPNQPGGRGVNQRPSVNILSRITSRPVARQFVVAVGKDFKAVAVSTWRLRKNQWPPGRRARAKVPTFCVFFSRVPFVMKLAPGGWSRASRVECPINSGFRRCCCRCD